MKRKAKTITVIAMLTILVPGWLYASGNLPPVFPQNERIIRAINDFWPDLAEVTFQNSRWAFQKLRNAGIEVPYTYNERLLRISQIKKQVVRICDRIITDS